MKRNQGVDCCPACGGKISKSKELPFLTRRSWREMVADRLGYDRDFIKNLGEGTRIHSYHFHERDIRDNKPIGIPELNIVRIDYWPAPADLSRTILGKPESETDVETIDVEDPDEQQNDVNPEFVSVEIAQLKLLLRQCYFCGHNINIDNLHCKSRAGIFFAKYWCITCKSYRTWRSTKKPFSQLLTASTMMAGIAFNKIIYFFNLLQFAIPSINSIYYSAKVVVYPVIKQFYQQEHKSILQHLKQTKNSIHLYMNRQYDLSGYSAYYCTATAIESITKKIIGYFIVSRPEANNNLLTAEKISFKKLIDYFISNDLNVLSITTDISETLNSLFLVEYPEIIHYIDIWEILRNMYKKFLPKFRMKRYPNLRKFYNVITRNILKFTDDSNIQNSNNLMIEKCLSAIFYTVDLHSWPEGRFVDIFNAHVVPFNFKDTKIYDIWMRNCLNCNNINKQNQEYEQIDPNSIEFSLLIDDICSDLRLEQFQRASRIVTTSNLDSFHSLFGGYKPKRFYQWYLDVCTILTIMHYNENIESNTNEKNVIKKNILIDRAVQEHNNRIQKLQLYKWQQNIMEYISRKPDRYVVDSDHKNLSNEYHRTDIAPGEPEDNEAVIEQEAFEIEWLSYLENDI